MIKKQSKIPLKIRAMEALLRRIHPNHPKRPHILESYHNQVSGYRGEQSLEYHLSFINDEYFIFHDLRLQDKKGRYFQIDVLIISTKFIIIMEVKNHKGTLIFDQITNQFIREFNGEQTPFNDPIIQTRRQRMQLQQFLEQHKLPLVPIETLVVVSNPKSIFKINPPNHPNAPLIIKSETIPIKVEGIERKHKKEYLTIKEMKKISRFLLKYNDPFYYQVLKQFEMRPSEILTGVYCPQCEQLAMTRKNGIWYCKHCNNKSRNAHVPSLVDYALLINLHITNKECRDFLRISSPVVASNLLKSLNVSKKGTYKDRQYNLNDLVNK